MTENNKVVVNQYSDPVMNKLIEISERIASVEAKVVSSSDIEKAVDKLEDKLDLRITSIENDVKSIGQSIHFIEQSATPKTPVAMKITAVSASVAIIIGGFTLVGMVNDNTRNQAKIQYIENQVQENQNQLKNNN